VEGEGRWSLAWFGHTNGSMVESLRGRTLCCVLVLPLKLRRFASGVGPPIHVMTVWLRVIGRHLPPWIIGCASPLISAKILHA
jgi:hypothetical protein